VEKDGCKFLEIKVPAVQVQKKSKRPLLLYATKEDDLSKMIFDQKRM